MDDNSWLMLRHQDEAFRLPQDLASRDGFGARDCGWVEQMRPFIRQFCPADGLVLDPFCGFGTTLLAAHLEGRRGLGVELEPDRAGIASERMARAGAGAAGQAVLAGNILDLASSLPAADLILTNIPYFGCRWEAGLEKDAQFYGTGSYASFLDNLQLVLKALKPALREDGFLIVMAENLRIGEHFVPMAWDAARLLAERYTLVDERILVYEREAQPLDLGALRSNRAHEYALIAQNRSKPIDLDDTRNCLQELAKEFSDFIVYGSYARWLRGEQLARLPSDLDLLVPHDPGQIARMVDWLQKRGFQVARWGAPLSPTGVPVAAEAAHYFRAKRLRPNGQLCIIDICFEDALIDYGSALDMASLIDGVRVLPTRVDQR